MEPLFDLRVPKVIGAHEKRISLAERNLFRGLSIFGRIVAEVFLGILTGDSQSYLQVDPGWTPAREGLIPAGKLADLVKFAISGK